MLLSGPGIYLQYFEHIIIRRRRRLINHWTLNFTKGLKFEARYYLQSCFNIADVTDIFRGL